MVDDKLFAPIFLIMYAVIMGGLGWLVGFAYGLKVRPKMRHCTDCGDKWDGLCADCKLKLNGEMSQ